MSLLRLTGLSIARFDTEKRSFVMPNRTINGSTSALFHITSIEPTLILPNLPSYKQMARQFDKNCNIYHTGKGKEVRKWTV